MDDTSVKTTTQSNPAASTAGGRRSDQSRHEDQNAAQALIDASDDLGCLIDAERKILAINEGAACALGKPEGELVGTTLCSQLPDALAIALTTRLDEVSRTKERLRFEDERDGKVFSVFINPVLNAAGDVEQVAGFIREISKHAELEKRLRQSEEKSRAWLEHSPVCTKIVDLDFNLLYMSAAGLDSLKITDTATIYGNPFPFDFYPEESRDEMKRKLELVRESGEIVELEAPVLDVDGGQLWFHSTLVPVNDDDGRVDYIIIVSIDVTARRATEMALRSSEIEHRALVEQASDAILVLDESSRITKSNLAARALFGLEPEVLHARTMTELIHPDEVDDDLEVLRDLERGRTVRSVRRLLRADAEWVWAELSARRLQDGRIQATARDISDRIEAEQRIRSLAYFDSLTNLPNRELFKQQIAEELERSARSQLTFALLFLDIDRFKQINDSLGHSSGDLLLKTIAERLQGVLRATDSVGRTAEIQTASDQPAASVSRLGGDEFTILVTRMDHPQDAARVARRVIYALSRPFLIAGKEIFSSTSIGIAVWPDDGDSSEILLRSADTAMYHAKKRGGNVYQFFTDSMNEAAARRLDLETKLRRALERDEFKLVYQPIRDSATGKVTAVEALLRWTDSEGQVIGPDEFIPIAEETRLIVDIGIWVLRTACRQVRSWQTMGYEPIRLAVNISVCQLRDHSIVERVDQILFDTGLSAAHLELEITETSVLDSNPNINSSVAALMEMGISFALDDFGTGYSSLSALQRFPIDRIKIDRSFVAGVGHNPENEALASAIVALAKHLDRKVVAEGVEDESQARFLTALGCDELQGYLFSRPVPAEEFEAFLTLSEKQSASQPDGL